MAKKKEQTKVETITTYKGFNKDLTCRDFQYEIGKTYNHEGNVKACGSGFHACEYPLDIFNYYPPSQSRFAVVEQSGDLSHENDGDSKVASRTITVKAEIDIPFLVKAAIEYTTSRCEPIKEDSPAYNAAERGQASATGYQGAASATGEYGAASATGYQGAASATGEYGAASATGEYGAASATGYQGAASATGYQGAASATGNRGAASATGEYGAASATGNRGAASATGYQGAASATGKHAVACGLGWCSKAMADETGAIVLVFRNMEDEIIQIRASKVGENGIKPNTWYQLDVDGEFVEVE